MISTSRKPRVVRRPTPFALRSMTMLEPSVVPWTAWATSAHLTPLFAINSSRPARHASDGSGYVVRRFAVVSSPDGDCSTKSVNVPPTSNPRGWAKGSAPAVGAGEDQPVGVSPAGLVGDRVLDRLAVRGGIGALEEEHCRARAHLEQLGDLPRRERRVHHLLHQLDLHAEHPLDGADQRGLREV